MFHPALILVILAASYGNGYRIGDDPYRRGEILDNSGGVDRYKLEWTIDRRPSRITFNVTVQTRGWILLGFANNEEQDTGRDVVIGGVWDGGYGQAYLSDKHTGYFNRKLENDASQDYTLLDSWESGTHTFLSFSRSLETCDKEDYPITENRVTLIWAYGDTDNENGDGSGGGGRNSGSANMYLTDPEYAPRVTGPGVSLPPNVQVWTVPKRYQLERNDTAYLCSVHKAPTLPRKHHFIGFDVRLADEDSRRHIHHMVILRCRAPRGSSARDLFESFAQSGQQDTCYSVTRGSGVGGIPFHFCQQFYIVWALGSRAYFLPDHVGFPFGEEPDEYYLTQIHYDNPQMRSDITVNYNLDFFYTSRLRPNEGAMFVVGHDIPGLPETTIIPPRTPRIRRFAHCPAECTRRVFPAEGITMTSMVLHSHISGRQLRMRHFRGNEELPWVLYDDNYSNNYQQIRQLPGGEVRILQGDQLTMDCVYDNTWTNGTVLNGVRTRQEMCIGFGFYYNRATTGYSFCRSEIVAPRQYRERFFAGVANITWLQSDLDWVAMPNSPSHLVGRTLTEISDNYVDWTDALRREAAQVQEEFTHTGKCNRHVSDRDPQVVAQLLAAQQQSAGAQQGLTFSGDVQTNLDTADDYYGPVGYPRVTRPYTPPESSCLRRGYFPKPRREPNFGNGWNAYK